MGAVIHDLDVIFLAVFAEARGYAAVYAVAQGGCGCLEVETIHGELLTVEVDLIFGLIVASRDHYVGRSRQLEKFAFEAGGHGVGQGEVVSVDLEVDRGLSAHAASHTAYADLSFLELGIVLEIFAHHCCDLDARPVAVAGVGQAHVHRDDMRAVVLKRREGVVARGCSGRVVQNLNLGIFLTPERREIRSDGFRLFDAGTYGKFEADAQASVVGGREIFAADHAHKHQRADEYQHPDNHCQGAPAHYEAQQCSVCLVEPVEKRVYRSEENAVDAAVMVVAFEQLRAEHRCQ